VLKDDETFYMQPEKLRHPLVFYFGHTAVFYINKLRVSRVITERIDARVEATCAIGVDEMSWDDLNQEHYNWPTIPYLREYRAKARALVDRIICTAPLELPITWKSPFWIILMGIEHERIHLETSSVLFRQLAVEYTKPSPLFPRCPVAAANIADAPVNALLDVTGGLVSYGKVENHHLYGWDNEYGTHAETVAPFKASKYLVSNAEYYQFVIEGGYETEKYWTREGWGFAQFLRKKNAAHPVFWVPAGKSEDGKPIFKYRTMTEVIDMPWDWPVDVNNLEAKAFCNWKNAKYHEANPGATASIRLPTEAEWHRLRDYALELSGTGLTAHEDDVPFWAPALSTDELLAQYQAKKKGSGECALSKANADAKSASLPGPTPGNINLEYFASSTPVDMFNFRNSGFYDVIGNVWQHSETPIAPFDGFKVHPAYDDFTVPTYDNMHNMIKGGSWISTGNEATTLSRYAFRRHFYQHAGFRYVLSEVPYNAEQVRELKEEDPDVANAIFDHYSPESNERYGALNYSVALSNVVFTTFNATSGVPKPRRILELGCVVGRGVFELAKYFPECPSVTGIDFTTRVIRVGVQLRDVGKQSYALPDYGTLQTYGTIDVTDVLSYSLTPESKVATDPKSVAEFLKRLEFMQGDACNLDGAKYTGYDIIVIASGLTNMYSPDKLMTILHERINPGGLLIIACDNDWSEDRTPMSSWLGGYKDPSSAEIVHHVAVLESLLGQHFKQVPIVASEASRAHVHCSLAGFEPEANLTQVQRRTSKHTAIRQVQVTAWQRK